MICSTGVFYLIIKEIDSDVLSEYLPHTHLHSRATLELEVES